MSHQISEKLLTDETLFGLTIASLMTETAVANELLDLLFCLETEKGGIKRIKFSLWGRMQEALKDDVV